MVAAGRGSCLMAAGPSGDRRQSMIPNSGNRFSEKIMLKQMLVHDPIQLTRIMV
jgi:hypothetical protein